MGKFTEQDSGAIRQMMKEVGLSETQITTLRTIGKIGKESRKFLTLPQGLGTFLALVAFGLLGYMMWLGNAAHVQAARTDERIAGSNEKVATAVTATATAISGISVALERNTAAAAKTAEAVDRQTAEIRKLEDQHSGKGR